MKKIAKNMYEHIMMEVYKSMSPEEQKVLTKYSFMTLCSVIRINGILDALDKVKKKPQKPK